MNYPPLNQEDEFQLLDVFLFFRRHWMTIAGAAVVASVLTAITVIFFIPTIWEASTTLVVVSHRFSSSLNPPGMTIEGYQKLLESDAVLVETRQQLEKKGVLPKGSHLVLGEHLVTEIFTSQKSEDLPTIPLLRLVARAGNPSLSVALAETWAQVFMKRAHEMTTGNTSSMFRLLEKQFPEAQRRLEAAEIKLLQTNKTFEAREVDITTKWEKILAKIDVETQNLLAAKNAKNGKLIDDFLSEKNLDSRNAESRASLKIYHDFQIELVEVIGQVEKMQRELEVSKKLMVTTPEFLTPERGVGKEGLLNKFQEDKEIGLRSTQSSSFYSSELNPAFVRLGETVVSMEGKLAGLVARKKQIKTDTLLLFQKIELLDSSLDRDQSELQKIELESEASLANLQQTRINIYKVKKLQMDEELHSLKREWDTAFVQANRNITQLALLHEALGERHKNVLLAKGQLELDVIRMASEAVIPDRPKAKGSLSKALVAMLVGSLLGLLLAGWRELSAKAKETEAGRLTDSERLIQHEQILEDRLEAGLQERLSG